MSKFEKGALHTYAELPDRIGRLVCLSGPAKPVVAASDATGLHNEAAWIALERKGLLNSMFPMAAVLTPEGVAYNTGMADTLLHRHGGH